MNLLDDPWYREWAYGYDIYDLAVVRNRWQHFYDLEHDTDRCYRDVPQAVILGLLDRIDRLEAARCSGPFRTIWPRPPRHPRLTTAGGDTWRPIAELGTEWDADLVEVLLDPSDSTVWWRPQP